MFLSELVFSDIPTFKYIHAMRKARHLSSEKQLANLSNEVNHIRKDKRLWHQRRYCIPAVVNEIATQKVILPVRPILLILESMSRFLNFTQQVFTVMFIKAIAEAQIPCMVFFVPGGFGESKFCYPLSVKNSRHCRLSVDLR